MKLQSRYRNHTFVVQETTFNITPYGRQIIRGISAKFEGPQRIFDSEYAAKVNKWDEETRKRVEEKLIESDSFLVDYFPAPGEQLDEALMAKLPAEKIPTEARRKCLQIGYANGNLIQCEKDATAGRDFCAEHDPETPKIKRGGGTTAG